MIAFNGSFFWGFQNFIVAAPFAIVGLALWLWSERLSIAQRLALFVPFALFLFIMHFGWQRDQRFWHLGAYAVSESDVFVPTLFQGVHSFRVLPEWSEYSAPALRAVSVRWLEYEVGDFPQPVQFLENWQRKFTHAVYLDGENAELGAFPELRELRRIGRFTLYSIDPGAG